MVKKCRGHLGSVTPYKPMVLQEYSEYVAEIQEIRAKKGYFDALGHHFGSKEAYVKISFEPLDENGNTIGDPILLDDDLQPVKDYVKSQDFPLKRE
jgi:hypothetical protein